jgi:glutamate--cysteine ligase
LEIAREVLAISENGLKRRRRIDCTGRTEATFLEPLQEFAASGVTPADELLALYEGPWQRNVDRIFTEYTF